MSKALTIVSDGSTLPAALGPDLAAAIDLAKAEKAASTRKAYGTDFRIFKAWCDAKGAQALPAAPETVAAYLASQAGTSKASTLGRRVAAIRYAHKLAGLALPTDAEGVKATMRGIRRTFGSAKNKKAPAVTAKMRSMVATVPDGLQGCAIGPCYWLASPARSAVPSSWRWTWPISRKPKPGCWSRSGGAKRIRK